MKKLFVTIHLFLIFTIISFLLTEQSFAGSINKFYNLQINITNNSSGDCFLTKNQILYGKLYESNLPDVIYNGQTAHFEMYYQNPDSYNSALLLTYQCGNTQEITLFSHYIWTHGKGAKYTLKGVALNATDLKTKVSYQYPKNNILTTSTPPIIKWTLINP